MTYVDILSKTQYSLYSQDISWNLNFVFSNSNLKRIVMYSDFYCVHLIKLKLHCLWSPSFCSPGLESTKGESCVAGGSEAGAICSLKAGLVRCGHQHRRDGRFWLVLTVLNVSSWLLTLRTSRALQTPLPDLWLLTNSSSSYTNARAFHRRLQQPHLVAPHSQLDGSLPDLPTSSNVLTCPRALAVASSISNAVCG